MRVRAWVLLLSLLFAGCVTSEQVRTLDASNDASCNTGYPDASCPSPVTTTTPLPFEGVAGTPNATENVPTGPTANDSTPPTPTDASPTPTPTTPSDHATPNVTANATTNATANATANNQTTRRHGGLAIGSAPIDADGNPVRSAWGGWSARPGDARAAGTNLIFVRNGNDSDSQFRVTFDAPAFAGVTDPSFLVPITGNVEFAVLELNGTVHRGDLQRASFSWGPGDLPTGITVTIHRPHAVAVVAYRIVSMPSVLLEQDYAAGYHVEEVAT